MLLQALSIISWPSLNAHWSCAQFGSNLMILFSHVTFRFDGWPRKKNRAPLLSNIKLCVSFHHHIWIPNGVTVRKHLSWFLTTVPLTFDFWPWPSACTSCLSMVITPEYFRMIRWQEHCQKGVTGRGMDRQTELSVLRAAWSQLIQELWRSTWWVHLFKWHDDFRLKIHFLCFLYGSHLVQALLS